MMTTHNRQTAASHKKLPTFYHHQQHVQYELHKLTHMYNITLCYLYDNAEYSHAKRLRAASETIPRKARNLYTMSLPMTNAPSQSRTLCYEKVKIVEIARTSKSNKHPPIELRELQVYSGGINVAQQGLAYQTSDLDPNTIASMAIDGDISSYSSTSIADDYNPYWGVR